MTGPPDITPDDQPLDAAIEAGAQALGAVVGAGLGLAGGPEAVLIGAGGGSMIGVALTRAGRGLRRFMSSRGEIRAATAFSTAVTVIQERLSAGEEPRSDGFFEGDGSGRPPAEELAEGMLRAAERSYEEQKVPYIGRLYANLCFDASVSRPEANHLLRLADALSYQQLMLLQLFATSDPVGEPLKPVPGTEVAVGVLHLLSEAFDLYLRGLLANGNIATFRPLDLQPSSLRTEGVGIRLVWATGLEKVVPAELNRLAPVFREHERRAFQP
jgi:hypothetical protein